MKIATKAGLVGFLLALGTLHGTSASAATKSSAEPPKTQTVETRLSRLTEAIRDREAQLPDINELGPEPAILAGWLNGRGGGFVNRRGGGGFVNRRGGGGFLNSNPWRNGWRDGGGFWNRRRW